MNYERMWKALKNAFNEEKNAELIAEMEAIEEKYTPKELVLETSFGEKCRFRETDAGFLVMKLELNDQRFGNSLYLDGPSAMALSELLAQWASEDVQWDFLMNHVVPRLKAHYLFKVRHISEEDDEEEME